MKRLLAISITSASITIGAIPAVAEVDSKTHKLCLEAKDYLGCVKAMTGKDESVNDQSSTAERCWGYGLERMCLAKEGIDNLGMPKLVNWFYQYDAAGDVQYLEADLKRTLEAGKPKFKRYYIPDKNEKRYLGIKIVRRYFVNTKPGYSGSSTTIGSASTYCNAYGGQVSCSTTPAPTINIPGKSAQPAKIEVWNGALVYDCKDKTMGYYMKEGQGKGWKKRPSEPSCSEIPFDTLETFDFKL